MDTLQTGREQKRRVDEWNWNEVREGHEVMLENVCLIEIVQVASPLLSSHPLYSTATGLPLLHGEWVNFSWSLCLDFWNILYVKGKIRT